MARVIERQGGYAIEVITSGPKPSDLSAYVEGRDDIDGVLWMPRKLDDANQPEGVMSGSEDEREAMTAALESVMGDYVTKIAGDMISDMISGMDFDIKF